MAAPMRKRTSEAWIHYDPQAAGETHVTCKHCRKKLSYKGSRRSGTSHLKRHAERHQRERAAADDGGLLQQPGGQVRISTAIDEVAAPPPPPPPPPQQQQLVAATTARAAAVAVPDRLHSQAGHSVTAAAAATSLPPSHWDADAVPSHWDDDPDTMVGGHLKDFTNSETPRSPQE